MAGKLSMKDWYDKHKAAIVKAALYFLVVVILILIALLIESMRQTKQQLPTEVKYIPVYTWKDAYGNMHARLVQEQVQGQKYRKQIDSLSKILKVKGSGIKSVSSIIAKTDTFFTTISEPVYVDSIKYQGFEKVDNYLNLKGIIRNSVSVDIKLALVDTLTFVSYSKAKFLGPTYYYIDISNRNPYSKIVAGYSYVKKEKTKRFGLGPVVSYNPITGRMGVGIGLSYNIVRF